MFISKKEKLALTIRITVLEGRIEQLARSLNAVLDAQTMASNPAGLKNTAAPSWEAPQEEKPKKRKSRWTPKKRAAHGEKMKKAWADRKAKLEAEAAANNSTPAN